ncbi:MAG: hypothetical protein PF961_21860 [Planctomycetota bacterium]|jgi:hypothetical protein|nr:hypothetical protein [Planctomycetota bacterium]
MRLMILFAVFLTSLAAVETRTLPNGRAEHWPHELVSMDFPIDQLDAYQVVTGMGDARPVQWERTERNGKPVARAWFIATITGSEETDDRGRTKRIKPAKQVELSFDTGSVPTGLSLREDGDYYLINNGVFDMRIRRSAALSAPLPFEQIPHWFGGSRVSGTDSWDGKAYMQGTSMVSAVETEIVNQGPVLIDLKITYTFVANQATGSVDALPLLPSKRTHFEVEHDGIQQRTTIPADSHHYSVLVRIVAGDPWAEVSERYHLPKDPAIADWGQHQYCILWGETSDSLPYDRIAIPRDEHVAIDTAMWTQWFEYDSFGGNNSLKIVPAEPRPAQKGRPFALIRPRWNQGGGGAQDFFLTTGGQPPLSASKAYDTLKRHIDGRKKQAKKNEEAAVKLDKASAAAGLAQADKDRMLAEKGKLRHEAREALKGLTEELDALLKQAGDVKKAKQDAELTQLNQQIADAIGYQLPGSAAYSPSTPAYGIVAAYPSKWVGPYQATIAAYVRDGQRGVRLGLRNGGGGGGNDGPTDNNWFGQRCYAIVTGERQQFQTTGQVNSLVRRHTDWTLAAQANGCYILDWERDASVLGPNILMSRERLEQLRAEYAAKADTPAMRSLAKTAAAYGEIAEQIEQLQPAADGRKAYETKRKELQTAIKKAEGDAKTKLEADLKALEGQRKDIDAKSKQASNEIKNLRKKLSKSEFKMAALIRGDAVSTGTMPSPSMYFNRYQDDANNPTNYGNRRLVNRPFPESDLFGADKPYGNADIAAIGYIYMDLDAWPGWQNGWGPGNPNFHTDKYIASVFAGATMRDHPHAKHWIAFGRRNFDQDFNKVIIAPDGVGYECPGYAGFSMHLQLETARVFFNAKQGNPMADNPLVKGNAQWHRHLITPHDFRIKRRHEAPHGDTHRWDSGMGVNFAELAPFYKDSDPTFASELMGSYQLLKDSGASLKGGIGLAEQLTKFDLSIPTMAPEQMDWTARAWFGFGATMRDSYGTAGESFLSFRAGRTNGHYHNDHLAYHFYAGGTPISLDYNCSYHPRGDHAALHNSMTFGVTGTVRHNKSGAEVEAMEQIYGSGRVGAFATSALADVVVAERSDDGLGLSPVDPHDAEFQRQYPHRKVAPIVHRRLLAMVKHEDGSPLGDYLVVRDETQSQEAQQINIHVLARSISGDGPQRTLVGQYDQDMLLHVAEATDLKLEQRWWHYYDEWMISPGADYEPKPDESQADWAKRMDALKASKGWDSIPGPGWEPRWKGGKGATPESEHWAKLIHDTKGLALLPPPGWSKDAGWLYGEAQMWLRLHTAPGTPSMWVLYPYTRGTTPPTITTVDANTVSVSRDGVTDTIRMGTGLAGGAVVIERNGTAEVLVDSLPQLGAIKDQPLK